MTPVYTDASSAILLEKTNLFQPVSNAFHLVMATSVFSEITRPGYPGAESFKAAEKKDRFTLQSPQKHTGSNGLLTPAMLGKGERDTLDLFLENNRGFILTDDGQAARWCDRHDLPFINALLVPKIFWYAGLMTEKQGLNKMKHLCTIGRYAEKIKAFAFACTSDDLRQFFPGAEK